jgi:hypothetical protein
MVLWTLLELLLLASRDIKFFDHTGDSGGSDCCIFRGEIIGCLNPER